MSDYMNVILSRAYTTLDLCGMSHPVAKRKGYQDGWEMLLDKHDDNEAAMFHVMLSQDESLSVKQRQHLLDHISNKYRGCDYLDYVDSVCKTGEELER
jgi:hypothetical protein